MGTEDTELKPTMSDIGLVIIGRNEGDRLKACANSAKKYLKNIVYVDSGSTDGSLEWIEKQGIIGIELDLSLPFTAARARNKGREELLKRHPETKYVQFVDGDCELADGWLSKASSFLAENPSAAIACGRRRERFPNASVYNELCDIEWNTPIGEAKACGGDAMMKVDILEKLGGFREDVIAGEEPELCFRIRAAGMKIWRLDHEMTLHDASIYRFGEWWKRSKRAGYAYFLGHSIHGKSEEKYYQKECRSILVWGGLFPCMILIVSLIFWPLGLLSILIYPLQWLRLWASYRNVIDPARAWAFFITVGKFAEFSGATKFVLDKIYSRKAKIIEYK